ncbi:ABC transporter permease [Paenibacillus glufosinatiresistens]|uniref:ABC transporter permease n=1 Tax=Paenibacillus glufosinatiresistens TaxID=3070657 RepID=UPI00286E1FB4|nr:ABC transporter permease subunit [Paenibacillus sp. YX.27]
MKRQVIQGYRAWFRKEWLESVRTYKLLILLTVFLILGILSPLSAKLLPDLLSGMESNGIRITLPEPAAVDSWAQFFKNISQMGLFVTVILFSGGVSGETAKGTLLVLLAKGLPRATVILTKYLVMSLLWTVSYGLAFAVTYGYTAFLFPGTGISSLGPAVLGLWLLGLFLLALLVFAGVWVKSAYGTLLIAGGGLALLLVAKLIPQAQTYNPLNLAALSMPLLRGEAAASELTGAAVTAGVGAALLLAAALAVFKRRPLT